MQTIFGFSRKAIESLAGITAQIAMWGVLCMTLLITVDVFMRYVVGRPLLFVDEVAGYLLVLVAYLAMAETLKRGRHIRVDVLFGRWPPRVQAWLDLILASVGFGALIVVAWRSVIMVHLSHVRGTIVTGKLLTPLYLPQTVLLIGLLVLTLQYVVELYKMLRALRGVAEVPPAEISREGHES